MIVRILTLAQMLDNNHFADRKRYVDLKKIAWQSNTIESIRFFG